MGTGNNVKPLEMLGACLSVEIKKKNIFLTQLQKRPIILAEKNV